MRVWSRDNCGRPAYGGGMLRINGVGYPRSFHAQLRRQPPSGEAKYIGAAPTSPMSASPRPSERTRKRTLRHSALQWGRWLLRHVIATAGWSRDRLDHANRCARVQTSLEYAIIRLPEAEDVRNYYLAVGNATLLRAALLRARPLTLCSMNYAMKELLEHRAFSDANVAYQRRWLDALLGPCEDLDTARLRCKRIFLWQHPDKVGKRDMGSPLYSKWSDLMWDLLVTTRKVLSEPGLAERLYESRTWRTRFVAGLQKCTAALRRMLHRAGKALVRCVKQTSPL